MTDKELSALRALQASKREIAPDAVENVFADALCRFRDLKDAVKWTKRRLHQTTGMFMTDAELHGARRELDAYQTGDTAALDRALLLHASTRERRDADALYRRVFDQIGAPDRALDLACGLNPLVLGRLGVSVCGVDMHAGAVMLVNDWARAAGWDVFCQPGDVLTPRAYPACDLALFMKLLPVLETQKPHSGARLLMDIPAKHKLVTFPTRTLGGRNVGMADSYAAWMEENMPAGARVLDRWTQDAELMYLISEE